MSRWREVRKTPSKSRNPQLLESTYVLRRWHKCELLPQRGAGKGWLALETACQRAYPSKIAALLVYSIEGRSRVNHHYSFRAKVDLNMKTCRRGGANHWGIHRVCTRGADRSLGADNTNDLPVACDVPAHRLGSCGCESVIPNEGIWPEPSVSPVPASHVVIKRRDTPVF